MSNQELQLRYGMNPHQTPARVYAAPGNLPVTILNGAPGYINFLDALNSWQLVRELKSALDLPAATSFKHVSPAGAAVSTPLSPTLRKAYFVDDLELSPLATAYARARGTDRISSFGDWVALSDIVDVPTANLLRREVSDGIIAPGYEEEALAILRRKQKGTYRILQIDHDYMPPELEAREVYGITLEQQRNVCPIDRSLLKNIVTTAVELPDSAVRDLLVATITLKYTQSNSICFALDGQTIGVGAGQQSRIHCTRLAAAKAQTWYLRQHPNVLGLAFSPKTPRPMRDNAIDHYIQTGQIESIDDEGRGLVEQPPRALTATGKAEWLATLRDVALSSDGYIPFRDNIDEAHQWGVNYVAQPGGSLRDPEVIAACNEHGMVMALTDLRLFHH